MTVAIQNSFRFDLKDLSTVRLVCLREGCGGVAEMPVDRLDALTGSVMCPSCNQPITPKQVAGFPAFRALGLTLKSLVTEKSFDVQFSLPVKTD